jgi:hypothetical protein
VFDLKSSFNVKNESNRAFLKGVGEDQREREILETLLQLEKMKS